MSLYDIRNKITSAFVKTDIQSIKFSHSPTNLLRLELESESKQKSLKTIAKRVKVTRQKNMMMNNQTLQVCVI